MTITEYRNELKKRMNRIGGGWHEGLKEAYELSEELIDTYDESDASVKNSLMTNRQLAEMLAKGYGQVRILPDDSEVIAIETQWCYFSGDMEDGEVPSNVIVRAWGSDTWVHPTSALYIGWKMGTLVDVKEN